MNAAKLRGVAGSSYRFRAAGALLGVMTSLACVSTIPPAAAVEAMAWRDLGGHSYASSDLRQARATVFVFSSTTCPCSDGYNSRVQELAGGFDARGVRFFQVFSEGTSTDRLRSYVSARGLTLPVVNDENSALARRFQVRVTPSAVVVDAGGTVRYRGRIDDNPDPQAVARQDLREALEDLLHGSRVRIASTRAIGCFLGSDDAAGANVGSTATGKRPKLASGLGSIEFRVTTRSSEAQRFFNQGMNRWFGFNFPEAEASFREAARLDPSCAMAPWGIALSLGMSYNGDYNPKRLPEATEAVARAVELSKTATPREQALISALAIRHAPGPDPGQQMLQQLQPYHDAMGRIYYDDPEDVNVAVLYAASGMDLRPWKLWTPDGRAEPGTLEILLVLEDALRRAPNHIGANHYYIHATEASPHPERALPSAGRLAAQAPESGHLVHMPSHTFIRLGGYQTSVLANRKAAGVDSSYFTGAGKPSAYGMYYIHNMDFIVACLMFEGRSAEAIATARDLSREASRWAPDFAPVFCSGASGLMQVYERFGKWDAILAAPAPAPGNPFSPVSWRFARGMAFAGQGKKANAAEELTALIAALIPAEEAAKPIPVLGEGLIQAMRTARHMLEGRLSEANGNAVGAEQSYRQAMTTEDGIPYTEPPMWRHPARESLGRLLLGQGRASEAEVLFREELKVHPHSGRALFGLQQALERQNRRGEAAKVKAEVAEAWARADVKLALTDL